MKFDFVFVLYLFQVIFLHGLGGDGYQYLSLKSWFFVHGKFKTFCFWFNI